MIWAYINAFLSAIVVAVIIYELVKFGDMLIGAERIGAGITASAMFLGIAIIMDVDKYGTPFDGWVSSLIRIGITTYIVGRITRHVRHGRNNQKAREIASDYLRSRGRI